MSAHPTVAVTGFCFTAMPNAMAAAMQASRETAQRCSDYNAAVRLHQQARQLLVESRIALVSAQNKTAAPRRATVADIAFARAVRKVLG